MKTLILYASKSGCSKEVSNYIGKKIKGSSVVNFNQTQPNLKKYDLIILGSGIYFSKINKSFKKFIDENVDDLLEKKFAIFFCCANHKEKTIKKIIDKNFKGRLQDNALAIICAGGYFSPSASRWPNSTLLRLMKRVFKMQKKELPEINHNNIDKFVELLSSITIIEEDQQLRNNPIPPIKDIKTRKERVKNINKTKSEHKQITDQKQKPKNEKIDTKNVEDKTKTSTKSSNNNIKQNNTNKPNINKPTNSKADTNKSANSKTSTNKSVNSKANTNKSANKNSETTNKSVPAKTNKNTTPTTSKSTKSN